MAVVEFSLVVSFLVSLCVLSHLTQATNVHYCGESILVLLLCSIFPCQFIKLLGISSVIQHNFVKFDYGSGPFGIIGEKREEMIVFRKNKNKIEWFYMKSEWVRKQITVGIWEKFYSDLYVVGKSWYFKNTQPIIFISHYFVPNLTLFSEKQKRLTLCLDWREGKKIEKLGQTF